MEAIQFYQNHTNFANLGNFTHNNDTDCRYQAEINNILDPIDLDFDQVIVDDGDDNCVSDKSRNSVLGKGSKKISKNNGFQGNPQNASPIGSPKKATQRGKRNPWQPHEDAKLLELVEQHGQSWSILATLIEGRTGKQIRDRYLNILRPNIKKGDWTPQEDQYICALYYQLGQKWSKISSYLPGRTEGQIKNRFYAHVKKKMLDNQSIQEPNSEVSLPTMQPLMRTQSSIEAPLPTLPLMRMQSGIEASLPTMQPLMRTQSGIEASLPTMQPLMRTQSSIEAPLPTLPLMRMQSGIEASLPTMQPLMRTQSGIEASLPTMQPLMRTQSGVAPLETPKPQVQMPFPLATAPNAQTAGRNFQFPVSASANVTPVAALGHQRNFHFPTLPNEAMQMGLNYTNPMNYQNQGQYGSMPIANEAIEECPAEAEFDDLPLVKMEAVKSEARDPMDLLISYDVTELEKVNRHGSNEVIFEQPAQSPCSELSTQASGGGEMKDEKAVDMALDKMALYFEKRVSQVSQESRDDVSVDSFGLPKLERLGQLQKRKSMLEYLQTQSQYLPRSHSVCPTYSQQERLPAVKTELVKAEVFDPTDLLISYDSAQLEKVNRHGSNEVFFEQPAQSPVSEQSTQASNTEMNEKAVDLALDKMATFFENKITHETQVVHKNEDIRINQTLSKSERVDQLQKRHNMLKFLLDKTMDEINSLSVFEILQAAGDNL